MQALPPKIYITRHGQSQYNLLQKLGGDSHLTSLGKEYATQLYSFFSKHENLRIWSSSLRRTQATVVEFSNVEIYDKLNELNAGICEHMTYKDIDTLYPHISIARKLNKYNFVYPGGESYHHLWKRVSSVLSKLNKDPTLIVCHQAVARMLIATLLEKTPESYTNMVIPLHTVFEINLKTKEIVQHDLLKK